MLLAIENKYLQYLEGNESDVLALFDRIKLDPRHHKVNRWIQGNTKKRIFSEWSMASWMLSKEELNSLTAIKDIDKFLSSSGSKRISSVKFIEMMRAVFNTWVRLRSKNN